MATDGELESGVVLHEGINSLVDQLNSKIQKLVTNDAQYLKTIDDLRFQLKTLRLAYEDSETKVNKLQVEVDKLKGHPRVICLLDGDGVIFLPNIIAQGREGGLQAASMLRAAIHESLSSLDQFQLWVYIFYHHAGLHGILGRSAHSGAYAAFHDFVRGFNKASERFIMVDVGEGKEAADAKIKAHLEDDIRIPQVSKIVFGGCHDDGYATTINGLVTAGYGDKLLLLRGYADMASGIKGLHLPFMTIPNLFVSEKLISETDTSHRPNYAPFSRASTTRNPSPSSAASDQSIISNVAPSISPLLAYQIALKNTQVPPNFRSGRPMPSGRLLDLDKPLSKQSPPPCTRFYLATCSWSDCRYSHEYILEKEHYLELRANAKKTPCSFRNSNKPCPYGELCIHGHTCPNVPKCYYARTSACKFQGDDMH